MLLRVVLVLGIVVVATKNRRGTIVPECKLIQSVLTLRSIVVVPMVLIQSRGHIVLLFFSMKISRSWRLEKDDPRIQ